LFEQWSLKQRGLLEIVLTNVAKEIMGLNMQLLVVWQATLPICSSIERYIKSVFKTFGNVKRFGNHSFFHYTFFYLSFKNRCGAKSPQKILFLLCLDTSILWLLKWSSVAFGREKDHIFMHKWNWHSAMVVAALDTFWETKSCEAVKVWELEQIGERPSCCHAIDGCMWMNPIRAASRRIVQLGFFVSVERGLLSVLQYKKIFKQLKRCYSLLMLTAEPAELKGRPTHKPTDY
jgi:hypothetical protein